MTLEEAILQKVRSLSLDEQQVVLEFLERLRMSPQTSSEPVTKLDWDSQAIGMWRDREEMQDSTDWVRQLRRQEWDC